jgi:hypothetical protein
LNDLYSRALREMETGQWYNARGLLEQVHKAQTGFHETERLLRKAEDEIVKIEEQNKRVNQVNVLYEQAHGLVRSKSWRKALDKMEEIQKLDDHFVDKDEIIQKSKIELEREDQEAQKQNQLAAMYADAVRLVKEEKFQEALAKWQEVRTIDSKYPDRQGVQDGARKKLAEAQQASQPDNKFSRVQARIGWSFWFLWILANIFGVLVGVLAHNISHLDFVPFAIMGFALGIGHWLVLRRNILWAGWWILASGVGLSVAGLLANNMIYDTGSFVGFAYGLIAGIGQWLVLRRQMPNAGLWLIVSVIGWGAAWGLGWRLSYTYYDIQFWPFILITGIIGGFSTGGMLVWLFNRHRSN